MHGLARAHSCPRVSRREIWFARGRLGVAVPSGAGAGNHCLPRVQDPAQAPPCSLGAPEHRP
eukprot:8429463-Pyramimonas_sp.AAC.1